jgi:hypothetical protein
MSGYLVIGAIEAVILLAVWRWDQRARRAELHRRRHLWLKQTSSRQDDSAATPVPALPASVPTAAGH